MCFSIKILKYFIAHFYKQWAAFIFFIFLLLQNSTFGQQATFYVSPDGNNPGCTLEAPGSLEMVQKKIRKINKNMSDEVQVFLSEGYYSLSKTFVLTNADGGTNGYFVTYRALSNKKPVISGAVKITDSNWELVGNGIYRHSVENYNFRQLYVNSLRAIRARAPNIKEENTKGPYYKVSSFNDKEKSIWVNASDVVTIENLSNVELVTQQHWYQNILRIGSVTATNNIAKIIPLFPARNTLFKIQDYLRSHKAGNSYHLENAPELLDAEGEWFLDTEAKPHQLYYKLRANENPKDLTAEFPNIETVIKIAGTSEKNVKNIRFEGVEFRGGNWLVPTTNIGMIATQGVQIRDVPKLYENWPAIISVEYAENIIFNKNIISAAGCNGLMFSKGVKYSKVLNNTIRDISANGIVIDLLRKNNPSTVDACSHNIIANNLIEDFGVQYTNGIGIIAGFVKNLLVEHNEIKNGMYMGIQIGNQQTDDFQGSCCNKVQYNNIHHVMQLHNDGGGIYTLGNQPQTHIFENWVHDIAKSSYAGSYTVNAIYLDNYSAYITVENNVLSNLSSGIISIYEQNKSGSYSHNNYILDNDSQNITIKDKAGVKKDYSVPDFLICDCDSVKKVSGSKSL
ncbi:MAG: right-handed parallel beta-helix repeat-containing protein [Niabella sp.]